ncbi:thermonuclease family protein [Sphingomonas cannabina]|uniref:thermonuclease family protein n=1 Tax=Sphingomonas cannabina TaxID=2899123 RepID=UPI001F21C935|nr:thermonuclease family protein [Sphingomonas cannabina]UIJ46263.1 thermonuclease family protein [Sphingomonas cannabina]
MGKAARGDGRGLRRAAGLAALLLTGAAPDRGRIAYVIDGDTFRLTSGERIRIAGIDAPETQQGQAKCAREIAAGLTATATVRKLLTGQTVQIERVGRSYRRTVARVSWNGRDLGDELVRSGIARWWRNHSPKPDWCGTRRR